MADTASSTRSRGEGFTVREAARRTGMPPHRVSYYGGKWGREGYGRFITPEIADAGQGTAKLFSRRNLVQLRVAFLLREAGLSEEETRHLLSAKGVGGKDWWDPKHPLGSDALLLVRGAPEWSGPSGGSSAPRISASRHRSHGRRRWSRPRVPIASSSTLAFNRAGSDASPKDRRDCWILEGTNEAWVVNIGQIRKAMNE